MVEGRPDIGAFLARTGMRQSELARSLGTTPANVSKWIRGDGVPSYAMCAAMLKIGATQEEIFGITPERDDFDRRVWDAIDRGRPR